MAHTPPKVLVVSTSRRTRGGITSVVLAHESCPHWHEYHCRWIETHIDKGALAKIIFFARALVQFAFLLPAYKIVHIHLSEPPSALRKSIFFVLARCLGKKTILHFHSFSIDTTLAGRFRSLYRWMFSRADATVVLSGYWKSEMEKLIGNTAKLHIIYNPCPVVAPAQLDKERSILFAGTMNQRKGYAVLIEAFACIAVRHPQWKLQFAGNGELDTAQSLIDKYGLRGQVQLLGWVSGQQKDDLFRRASIFCLPSYAEGFPMAVLDAWSYGLPVVCTPVGGLPEIVEDGTNALLFPCGDSKALARQLELIISNDLLRRSISEQSLVLAHNTFDLKNIGHQIGQLYHLLGAK